MPVPPPSPAAPLSPWQTLPPEMLQHIAAQLDSRDLFALSQASRAGRAAAAPNWQGAYGPEPCHRVAVTPAEWRLAALEKHAYEDRLLAPPRVTRGTLPSVALRLRARRPVAALIAVQAGGIAALESLTGTRVVLGVLCQQGRTAEAVKFAAEALACHPTRAQMVMEVGLANGDFSVCNLALDAGAAAPKQYDLFGPTLAAIRNDPAQLRMCLRCDPGTWAAEWKRALGYAVQRGALDMAETILEKGLATAVEVDFSVLTAEQQALFLDLLHRRHGLCMVASLLKTAESRLPEADAACQRLADQGLQPDKRQAFLDRASNQLLEFPNGEKARKLRRLMNVGGRPPGLAEFTRKTLASTPYNRENDLITLLAAGVDPETPFNGTSILCALLREMGAGYSPCEAYYSDLANWGLQVPASATNAAHMAIFTYHFNLDVIRSLGAMGMNFDTYGTLLCAAHCGRLAAVRAMVEGGASVAAYDDAFHTAIDVTDCPEMMAYLQGLGLQRSHSAQGIKPFIDPASR